VTVSLSRQYDNMTAVRNVHFAFLVNKLITHCI